MPTPQQVLEESTRVAQEAARVAGFGGFMPKVGVTGKPKPIKTDTNQALVRRAAGAGMGLNDLPSIIQGDDPNAIRDELAKTHGYDSFDAFQDDVFTRPSVSTQDLYKKAYQSAGLDKLLMSITDSKNKLAEATGQIGENPWLSEASRAGRVRRLQELANAEIGNQTELYNARLNEVNKITELGAQDLSENERVKEARFNFLLQQAEAEATQRKASALGKYLPDYLDSVPAGKPDTITVGDSLYMWDEDAGQFKRAEGISPQAVQLSQGQALFDPATGERIAFNPKTYAPKANGPDPAGDDGSQDTQDAYTYALGIADGTIKPTNVPAKLRAEALRLSRSIQQNAKAGAVDSFLGRATKSILSLFD